MDIGQKGLNGAHVKTEIGFEREANVMGEVKFGLEGLVEVCLGCRYFLHL